MSDKKTPNDSSDYPELSHDTCELGSFADEEIHEIHEQIRREKLEPTELSAPIPLFLVVLFAGLFFWAGFYFSNYSGGFRPDVFNPEMALGEQKAEVEKVFDPIAQGKKVFSRICQQCHQADGQGLPAVYPPLAGSRWVVGAPERAVKILLAGLQGPITVLGNEFNGNMPNHSMLKDRDIAAVLTFVRQNWGNNADPVSEKLVTQIRGDLGGRSNPWTADELLKLYPLE